jgi:hypothetical protein
MKNAGSEKNAECGIGNQFKANCAAAKIGVIGIS